MVVDDCIWEQALDGGQNMGNIPLAYGQAFLHALGKDKPMVPFEWGLSVEGGDGEGKPGGILRVEWDVEEAVFYIYGGKHPVSGQPRW